MDHGLPNIFESDGGIQFSFIGFQFFSERLGNKMEIIFTVLPQSNGLAENGVKKLKGMITKIIDAGGHLD